MQTKKFSQSEIQNSMANSHLVRTREVFKRRYVLKTKEKRVNLKLSRKFGLFDSGAKK